MRKPTDWVVVPDSPQEIEAYWKGKGVTRDISVITYCQSAVRAAHSALALSSH